MNLGGRLWTQLFNVRHSHCPSIFHVAELLLSRDHPLRCPAISGWNAAVTVKKRGGLWVASESSSKIAELYGYSSHKQISGWWLSPTPLKNDGLGNSWDDEIPNICPKCSKPPTSQTYVHHIPMVNMVNVNLLVFTNKTMSIIQVLPTQCQNPYLCWQVDTVNQSYGPKYKL